MFKICGPDRSSVAVGSSGENLLKITLENQKIVNQMCTMDGKMNEWK